MTIDEVFTREELMAATRQAFARWFSDRDEAVGMDAEYWKMADIADSVDAALQYADIGGISIYPPRNVKKRKGAANG